MSTSTIKIFTCGGTIDKIYYDAKDDFHIGEPQILEILKDARITREFDLVSLFKKDSLELTDEDRAILRDAIINTRETSILVTHGTDTMVDTGKFLQGIEGKTIVITGSMTPARFRVTDAVFNVGMAFVSAQTLPPGVYIAMNGRIFDPLNTWKNVPEHRFEEL
jgi:L-asparaginase